MRRTFALAAVEQLLAAYHVAAHASSAEAGSHGGHVICIGRELVRSSQERLGRRLPRCHQPIVGSSVKAIQSATPLHFAPLARNSEGLLLWQMDGTHGR